MNEIEKMVSEFLELLEEIENEEARTMMMVLFLSSCGMNEEQMIEWFKSFNKENE